MKSQQVEAWARELIDRVQEGHLVEDSRVELKAQPISPSKAARRLAAHANAAAGEDILWIIGVDEEKGPTGVDWSDWQNLQQWFEQVRSFFDDGVAPELLMHPHFSLEGKEIVPLLLSTDRAPYIVQVPEEERKAVHREIPFRSATGVRSLKRGDLMRVLYPKPTPPPFYTHKFFFNWGPVGGGRFRVRVSLGALIEVPEGSPTSVIARKSKFTIDVGEGENIELVPERVSLMTGGAWRPGDEILRLSAPGIAVLVAEEIVELKPPPQVTLKALIWLTDYRAATLTYRCTFRNDSNSYIPEGEPSFSSS